MPGDIDMDTGMVTEEDIVMVRDTDIGQVMQPVVAIRVGTAMCIIIETQV